MVKISVKVKNDKIFGDGGNTNYAVVVLCRELRGALQTSRYL
jgi:hypothetical protein